MCKVESKLFDEERLRLELRNTDSGNELRCSSFRPFTVTRLMAALRQAAQRTLFRPPKSHYSSRNLFSKATSAPRSPIATDLYATALVVSTGLFAVYYFDARSGIHRYVIMPVLRHTVDAETSHQIAVKVLRIQYTNILYGASPLLYYFD